MSFHDEQQESPAPEILPGRAPEPRLLTRPDRDTLPETAKGRRPEVRNGKRGTGSHRHAQSPAEKGLQAWSRRLAQRRATTSSKLREAGAQEPRTGFRRARFALRTAAALAIVLLVFAMSAVLYLRHAIGAAMPQLDGSVQSNGLRAAVTVARDAQGVPTITASNLPDLLFAQGYTTAGDRLWQMDTLRRHASGELAAVLGSGLVEHDRRQRYLQVRAAADRAVQQLPSDQLQELQAYAKGVNAYIDSHRNALPVEFRLLAYTPEPWTPRDSLLVFLAMWQDLSTEFPHKLDREALSTHLPPSLVSDLYPVGSWRDMPPAVQGRDITAPHLVEQIPLDPSQSHLVQPPPTAHAAPEQLLALGNALAGDARCEGCRSGSNNWVVSGKRTASGAPLLSNDMHLSLSIPDIWYEASLHTDLGNATGNSDDSTNASSVDAPLSATRLDVTGFTLPGVPFVIVGRNAHVAWGVTNLGADVQDLRIEHLRGTGPSTEYQRADGSWAPVTHHPEVIRVRNGLNTTVDVMTTTHLSGESAMETPVISPLYPGEQRPLSLAWTAYDPTALSTPFLGLDMATDGNALAASLASLGGPTLNLLWADASGHIGYHAVGRVPVRGPAIQHPRAVQAPVIEPGTEPTDESTDEPTEPAAALPVEGHLVLSAYIPQRRGQHPLPGHRGRGALHTAPPLATRRGRVTRTPAPKPAIAPAQPVEAPLPPAPPRIEYTIGSPISPVPVDSLDASQQWSEYIPYGAMPAVLDPANGLLATANARIAPDDYPYALTLDWTDPFRVERIVHLLQHRSGLTPADMLHMQVDAHSEVNLALAQRLAYAVDHSDRNAVGADSVRALEAANLLRGWQGDMSVNSSAAAIVATVRTALWPALLVPRIAAHDHIDAKQAAALTALYTWNERTTALELLLQHEPARWLPPGFHNWNDFLATTMARALREAHAPENLDHWKYGAIHTVEIDHPVFSRHTLLSRAVGVRATTGTKAAPGDGSTIDAIGAHFGPSERFTADLSSPTAALGNITTGQSANPRSPWYLDQFRAWLAGQSFALPGPDTQATHTLTLTP